MAGKTKALSGPGKDKFLRAIAARTTDQATFLEALLVDVPEIRVRLDVWKETLRRSSAEVVAKATDDNVGPRAVARHGKSDAGADSSKLAATQTPAFDPFAFSVVALLTRQGKSAVEAKLASIDDAINLRALADAQHLAVDQSVTDLAMLRAAIVAGAERRMAERIAAAS
jgi:hypothetical protein